MQWTASRSQADTFPMPLVRAFIALEIPPALRKVIEEKTAGLRQAADASLVRWIQPGNLHLTLKFLGDVSSATIPFITQALTAEAARFEAFELQLGRLGAFPTSKRPRVIWVGIQAPAALETLQRDVEAATVRLGYPSEDRPFSPHLTIGRVKAHLPARDLERIHAAVESHPLGTLGRAGVNAVHLIKSELHPSGSVYTKLFSAPFAGVK